MEAAFDALEMEEEVDELPYFTGEVGLVCKIIIQAVYSFLYGSGEEKKEAEMWIFGDQSAINSFDNLLDMLNIDIDPNVAREALLRNIPDRIPIKDKRIRRWNYGNEGKNSSGRRGRTRDPVFTRNDRRSECSETIDWIQHIFNQSVFNGGVRHDKTKNDV